MPGRWQVFLVLLSIAWQLILITEYLTREDTNGRLDRGHSALPSYDVVIGILSARGNNEQRQALRETWVGHVPKNSSLQERVIIKFVVGNRPCPIPPQDRLGRYSCEPDALVDPVLDQDIIAYRVPKGAVGLHTYQGPLGMDFRLGVFDSNSDGLQSGLTVRLYDRISQMEVLSANFTSEDPGGLIGGSRFKPVDQYVLPKGFEGSIVAENFSSSDSSSNNPMIHGGLDSGGGLISFHRVSRYGVEQGVFPGHEEKFYEENNQYGAGTFMYRAYVADSEFSKEKLEEKRKHAGERKDMWRAVLLREEQELQREMQMHADILMVDVVDVYRNLPKKLLEFYSWAVLNTQFNFTLKTDDDCFVDIEAILQELSDKKLRGKERIWWSGFRTDWPVEHAGKWRELDYTAPVYPSFACGAGNVLSADLVRWLALNSVYLKPYQGEDVSVGIWLSAVGPNFVNDYRWSCGRECDTGTFTSPENDPEELREMWSDLQTCGDPCGCS
ncbi:UDP-GalNAc:beta-1,3-N-acetylgalactosaminyltransferase 2-like isoform X2 [Oculina patagonica]